MLPQEPFSTAMQRLCWADLATCDAEAAKSFYRQLFGWTPRDRHIGEGRFTLFWDRDIVIASLYQLTRKQIEKGIPSHWMPYISVPNADAAASKAASLGAQVIVSPHDAGEMARICVICDPTGALIGLWQKPLDRDVLWETGTG